MKGVAETDRLLVRELVEDDASFMLRLVNDPSWLRFIGDRGVRDLDGARRFVRDGPRASYAANGFGMWCVVEKASGDAVGTCGILRRAGLPDPDLGFAFLPSAWGRGLATESARAVLAVARDALGLRRILAITTLDNEASMRVLGRLGFARTGSTRLPTEDRELALFALDL